MAMLHTEPMVRSRTKTVTRRRAWRTLQAGDRLTLCRRVQWRGKDPLVRLAEVEVVDVRVEPLAAITPDDVTREGFPDMTREAFIAWYSETYGVRPDELVTRIEWRYLEP